MNTYLNWKKGIFNSTSKIFSGNIPIGYLKEKNWSQSVEGEINGKKYHFKTNGFFTQETQIIDYENNLIIGRITYNSWNTKAWIENQNRVTSWKYDNAWNSKWSVTDNEGARINYQCSSMKGSINADLQNDLMLLAGLFIANKYQQNTMLIVFIALIPVWISVIN